MPGPIPHAKAGFTLMEALITLAVTGVVLGLIFTVAENSRRTAFRLGLRAVESADQRLRADNVRSVLSALVLPPMTAPTGTQVSASQDDSFLGTAQSITAWFSGVGPGLCGRAGRTGRASLTLAGGNPGHITLTCQVDTDAPSKIDLPLDRAGFSYSDDAQTWQTAWEVDHGQTVTSSQTPNAELRKVYIRLAAADAAGAIVERAADARPANPANANAASIP
jgi:type II secretory pathway pseudopilin PulG